MSVKDRKTSATSASLSATTSSAPTSAYAILATNQQKIFPALVIFLFLVTFLYVDFGCGRQLAPVPQCVFTTLNLYQAL